MSGHIIQALGILRGPNSVRIHGDQAMTIIGNEKVVSTVGRWNPSDVAFVENLTIEAKDDGAVAVELTARLQPRSVHSSWPSDDGPWFIVKLAFSDVRNFRVSGFGPSALQIMGFEIEEQTDRGLDGIDYRIGDYENDKMSFYCSRIEVLAVVLKTVD